LIASTVNLTSADVKGVPSCQRTPGRSFHVTSIPPSARITTPPFSGVGISEASNGTTFIASSVVTSPSTTHDCTSSRMCVLNRLSVSGSRS
jgi:hypothetical protein